MSTRNDSPAREKVFQINTAPLIRPKTPEHEYRDLEDVKFLNDSGACSPLSSALSNPEFPAEPTEVFSARDGHRTVPRESSSDSFANWQNQQPTRVSKGPSESAIKDAKLGAPRRSRASTTSPYFLKLPSKKVKGKMISCIPCPSLNATSFGLVQETLCHDPFQLFIAVIFLNKTRGSVAMPVFYDLITRLPTPADLAAANHEDIVSVFQHLGLQNTRATKCINLAKTWLETPPVKGKRYRRLHYPNRDDGKDIGINEGPISDEDDRVAWEVGHLPGIGSYAIDSWRIFCRDELRGLPTGLPEWHELERDPAVREVELSKEWTRVLPLDKELRAYLKWRWLRLGFEWDPVNGERKMANESVKTDAIGGGVICEGGESDDGGRPCIWWHGKGVGDARKKDDAEETAESP